MNIALRAKACDSLVVQQEKTIQSGLKYEASQDSLLRIRSLTTATLKDENSQWEKRFNNQNSLTKIEKKKKRNWIFISIGLAALGIYTNLP